MKFVKNVKSQYVTGAREMDNIFLSPILEKFFEEALKSEMTKLQTMIAFPKEAPQLPAIYISIPSIQLTAYLGDQVGASNYRLTKEYKYDSDGNVTGFSTNIGDIDTPFKKLGYTATSNVQIACWAKEPQEARNLLSAVVNLMLYNFRGYLSHVSDNSALPKKQDPNTRGYIPGAIYENFHATLAGATNVYSYTVNYVIKHTVYMEELYTYLTSIDETQHIVVEGKDEVIEEISNSISPTNSF